MVILPFLIIIEITILYSNISRIASQQSSNIIYVKKEVYDIVVNQLLIKINTLEKKSKSFTNCIFTYLIKHVNV